MKLFRSIALLALTLLTTGTHALNARRPWLFFVYVAADNNLWPEADVNINQMVKASATRNAYIVVHLNIKRDGQKKQSQLLLIQDGQIISQSATTVEDSGDYKTLIKSLSTAIATFPADHILVDLWNHGSGPLNRNMLEHRGVCYDDSTGHFMTDRDYKAAFDTIVNQYLSGKKIDIIAFDACLMADLEVAYTLVPYANYLVSSQETVPGSGFNYATALAPLAKSVPTAATFAQSLVQAYDAYYKPTNQSYTLSAVNLAKVTTLTQATNTFANVLNGLLKKDASGTLANGIYNATTASNMPQLDESTYLDLYTFCSNLYMDASKFGLSSSDASKLKTTARSCMTAQAQAVLTNVRSKNKTNAKGLSIYFADWYYGMEPSYPELYWSEQNPAWVNFLNSYLAKIN